MTVFDDLHEQYLEIDQLYADKEFTAMARGWVKKEKHYQRKRMLNDQAYFLFMFTRLEEKVITESTARINRQKTNIRNWRQRAVWDIIPKKLYFMNRVALLTEKGNTDYNLIKTYYDERNSIAHGGNFISPLSMPTVINNFKRLFGEIRN